MVMVADQESDKASERRRYRRVTLTGAAVSVGTAGPAISVRMLDVSRVGAGLLMEAAVDADQEIRLWFVNGDASRVYGVSGKVRRISEREDDRYHIGVEFEKPLSDRALDWLSRVIETEIPRDPLE